MLLNRDGTPPTEHKIFVFGGRAEIVWTIYVDNQRVRYDAVYDRGWQPLYWRALNRRYESALPRPKNLERFVELAEAIAASFYHMRVDFYECNGEPFVGELTPYNLSGLTRFEPDGADFILGSFWQLNSPIRKALRPFLSGLLKKQRKSIPASP